MMKRTLMLLVALLLPIPVFAQPVIISANSDCSHWRVTVPDNSMEAPIEDAVEELRVCFTVGVSGADNVEFKFFYGNHSLLLQQYRTVKVEPVSIDFPTPWASTAWDLQKFVDVPLGDFMPFPTRQPILTFTVEATPITYLKVRGETVVGTIILQSPIRR